MIYNDQQGQYIIEGIGNRIYLPKDRAELIEFIGDYFIQKELPGLVSDPGNGCNCSIANCDHCGTGD